LNFVDGDGTLVDSENVKVARSGHVDSGPDGDLDRPRRAFSTFE
jgi:hypothetical protein